MIKTSLQNSCFQFLVSPEESRLMDGIHYSTLLQVNKTQVSKEAITLQDSCFQILVHYSITITK
jgi:hypothetical protein